MAAGLSQVDLNDPNPNPDGEYRIVALGDSFISGEGADTFFPGTNETDGNRCRRSSVAYPYVLAQELGASLTFAACSSAEIIDVVGDRRRPNYRGQFPDADPDVLGGSLQIGVLDHMDRVDAVLLSIGGNDALFSEVVQTCIADDSCVRYSDRWMRNLESIGEELYQAYTQVLIRSNGADVVVVPYPNPFYPTNCSRSLLGADELAFLTEDFIPRLNLIIEFAAVRARVHVADTTNALAGALICEPGVERFGLNIVKMSTVGDNPGPEGLAASFHPNELGHQLIARSVLATLGPLLAEPAPAPQLAGEPQMPPAPPPFVPSEFGTPDGPQEFPPDAGCSGAYVARIELTTTDLPTDSIEVPAAPESLVCHRTYKGTWEVDPADLDGATSVPVLLNEGGMGNLNQILYQEHDLSWTQMNVLRPLEGEPPKAAAWKLLRLPMAVTSGWVLSSAWLLIGCRRRDRTG